MANQYLRLHCDFCSESTTIGKYYPTWMTGDPAEGGIEMYDGHAVNAQKFIARHSTHNPDCGKLFMAVPGFSLTLDA